MRTTEDCLAEIVADLLIVWERGNGADRVTKSITREGRAVRLKMHGNASVADGSVYSIIVSEGR